MRRSLPYSLSRDDDNTFTGKICIEEWCYSNFFGGTTAVAIYFAHLDHHLGHIHNGRLIIIDIVLPIQLCFSFLIIYTSFVLMLSASVVVVVIVVVILLLLLLVSAMPAAVVKELQRRRG